MANGSARIRTLAIVGPECTGKSTLAAELARAFDAPVSAEAARLIAEGRREISPPGTPADALLGPEDVERIARAQLLLEVRAEERARDTMRRVAIRDTDLVSTVVYARHYYGACPAWVEDAARRRLADRYLLCDVDVAWIDDGVRDRPNAREEMRDAFARALDEFGAAYTVVSGAPDARLRTAARVVEDMLGDVDADGA